MLVIISITVCVQAAESSNGEVVEVGNGVFVIHSYVSFGSSFDDELYVAQSISTIITEHPDMEYVSLVPHTAGYGQTFGYIAIFRPKHSGNCTARFEGLKG
ncbi:MAG TPA: hypothetical protein PLD14_02960 [Candidatus Pacearchaeota archaeon]|nr:hypothetical protein [Candidatus Pacearchaeota archaeon]HPR80159.1 hypothetical protein [Candidatus Pacearchaeota archaeon]